MIQSGILNFKIVSCAKRQCFLSKHCLAQKQCDHPKVFFTPKQYHPQMQYVQIIAICSAPYFLLLFSSFFFFLNLIEVISHREAEFTKLMYYAMLKCNLLCLNNYCFKTIYSPSKQRRSAPKAVRICCSRKQNTVLQYSLLDSKAVCSIALVQKHRFHFHSIAPNR